MNHLAERHYKLWLLRGGAEDLNPCVWIGKLPLPLIANHLHLHFGGICVACVNRVKDANRGNEDADHRNQWDQRPDDLQQEVAVRLCWE